MEQEWTEREKRATASISPDGSDMPEEECEGDTSDESEECIVKVLSLTGYSELPWNMVYKPPGKLLNQINLQLELYFFVIISCAR